ncbi:MAG: Peptide deformylase [uncultured bacterium]|nr:MAG: Peptide deformylase [uncultured bacterium]KKU52714.1 MAG: Peptide deformylase [Parcubacteria group bacterium GW2011_GWA2_47_10]
MAILPVEKGPENPILRGESPPVKKVDKKLKKLIGDMEETMFDLNGVGIAAPQVGVNLQLALARLNVDTKNEIILTLINPKILNASEEKTSMEEGCLSLPGYWGAVKRHKSLTVIFENEKGQQQTLFLQGFNARVIQHEVDHLNAKLFIDRATKVRQEGKEKPNS